MVLVVLVISGTLLASAARRSCGMALRAGSDQEELQLRWGALSCAAVCLPAAEGLLASACVPGRDPVAQTRRAIALGGLVFQLIVSDEQAKANANLLARLRGETVLTTALQKLQEGRSTLVRVQLRANPPPPGSDTAPVPFSAFSQLYAFKHPAELVGARPGEAAVADRVTCWGSGSVNLMRAEKPVLHEVLATVLTDSDLVKVETLRRAKPASRLGDVVKLLTLSKEKAKALGQFATDASTCHGLWVVAQGRTRDWYEFRAVVEGDSKKGPTYWTFTW